MSSVSGANILGKEIVYLLMFQGFIQKEKTDIDSPKGAQISMLANKINESILSFRSPNKP